MTYYEFLQLPDVEQAYELLEAEKLAERIEGDCFYVLFELYGFYVEVKYNKGITAIKPFASTYYLDPYLEEIDITEITCL
jgi:hypothetical protein